MELAAAEAKGKESPPPPKAAKQKRCRQPLNGGTLLREGKVYKAPQRDSKNIPLKQAQVSKNE